MVPWYGSWVGHTAFGSTDSMFFQVLRARLLSHLVSTTDPTAQVRWQSQTYSSPGSSHRCCWRFACWCSVRLQPIARATAWVHRAVISKAMSASSANRIASTPPPLQPSPPLTPTPTFPDRLQWWPIHHHRGVQSRLVWVAAPATPATFKTGTISTTANGSMRSRRPTFDRSATNASRSSNCASSAT